MEEEFLREYQFHVSGYIPGIPGMFSGGSRVLVDERTNTIVAVNGVALLPPALPIQEEAKEPAPIQEEPIEPEQGVALPVVEQNILGTMLGGNS